MHELQLSSIIKSAKFLPRIQALKDCRLGFSFKAEEHTSELQLRQYLVCRLLLEKIKMCMLCAWMMTRFQQSSFMQSNCVASSLNIDWDQY